MFYFFVSFGPSKPKIGRCFSFSSLLLTLTFTFLSPRNEVFRSFWPVSLTDLCLMLISRLRHICIGDLYCLGSPFPVPACLFYGNGYVRSKPASFNLRRAAAEAILAKEPAGDNLAVCCRDLLCRLRRLGAEHLASGEVLTSSTLGTLASCSKDISSKQGSLRQVVSRQGFFLTLTPTKSSAAG